MFVFVYTVCFQLKLFVLSICLLSVCSYPLYQSVRLYPYISIWQQQILIPVHTAQNCNSPYLTVTNLPVTDRIDPQHTTQHFSSALLQAAHSHSHSPSHSPQPSPALYPVQSTTWNSKIITSCATKDQNSACFISFTNWLTDGSLCSGNLWTGSEERILGIFIVNRTVKNWNKLPAELFGNFRFKPEIFRWRVGIAIINWVKWKE